jgi:hypothetical protein
MVINRIVNPGGGSFEFDPEPQRKVTGDQESRLPDFAEPEIIDAEVVNNPLKDIQPAPDTIISMTAPLEAGETLGEIMAEGTKSPEAAKPTEIADKIKQERQKVTPTSKEVLLNDPFLVGLRAELKDLDYNERLLLVNAIFTGDEELRKSVEALEDPEFNAYIQMVQMLERNPDGTLKIGKQVGVSKSLKQKIARFNSNILPVVKEFLSCENFYRNSLPGMSINKIRILASVTFALQWTTFTLGANELIKYSVTKGPEVIVAVQDIIPGNKEARIQSMLNRLPEATKKRENEWLSRDGEDATYGLNSEGKIVKLNNLNDLFTVLNQKDLNLTFRYLQEKDEMVVENLWHFSPHMSNYKHDPANGVIIQNGKHFTKHDVDTRGTKPGTAWSDIQLD